VQLGIDVCFDIFYCLGMILMSLVMVRDEAFGPLIGGSGAALGAALIALNLYTFPTPPDSAGLVDLGPVTGIWWIVVIVRMVQLERRARSAPEASQA
jgi:hypothetical protein